MPNRTEGTLRFTELCAAHLNEIMAIELEAYQEPWTMGMFHDEIRKNLSYFVVAFLDDAIAAYGGYWLVLDEVHITSVTVKAQMRGHGYGREVADHLLYAARQAGARTATLEVRGSNTNARNLYKSMGFTDRGIRKKYYPATQEDAIVMTKEIQ